MLLIWAGSDNRTLRSTQQLLNTKVNHFKVKVKNFNSTMVRLKANLADAYRFFYEFQFHYGSVKRLSNYLRVRKYILFQFHYGSVKRNAKANKLAQVDLFQFHYGSVKSGLSSGINPLLAIYFNSTMVRLKVDLDKMTIGNKHDFNSTMVRLKV